MNPDETSAPPKKKNLLEWIVFGLSLAILIGVIGMLIYQALDVGDDPPLLSVTMEDPVRGHGQLRIPLLLSNKGDRPAIEVQIEVSGTIDGEKITSSVHFDYVPRHAKRAGWVTFPGEVLPTDVSARVLGYADP